MLGITIICVGKLKEDYLRAACSEYTKRLGAYCKLSVVEIDEEFLAKGRDEDSIKRAEGTRILAKIPSSSYVVALAVTGRQLSSDEFAQHLNRTMSDGTGRIVFIIGGSLGLSPEVMQRADYSLSFSKMTFPHQLMRVVLLEQVYRALNVLNGGKYHK
ncbi:MAG: 23S rRNA (pseudouridine(1915)-N(3))-methyltransferase RlmH [Defluviitaleaceae bacterium]|nr:23S rRNA (pseudouridine(1915)-N(3))-methyltransferase RlmH [Defluviitaleaceae bacterium]